VRVMGMRRGICEVLYWHDLGYATYAMLYECDYDGCKYGLTSGWDGTLEYGLGQFVCLLVLGT
jgi:hypothetical protein